MPKGTSLTGFIYYAEKNDDNFDESKRIEFNITNVNINGTMIKLPKRSSKINITYYLKNTSNNINLSPILDHLTVYGK